MAIFNFLKSDGVLGCLSNPWMDSVDIFFFIYGHVLKYSTLVKEAKDLIRLADLLVNFNNTGKSSFFFTFENLIICVFQNFQLKLMKMLFLELWYLHLDIFSKTGTSCLISFLTLWPIKYWKNWRWEFMEMFFKS